MSNKDHVEINEQRDKFKKNHRDIISWNSKQKIKILDKRIEDLKQYDYSSLNEKSHSFGEEAFTNVFIVASEKALSRPMKALIGGFLGGFFVAIGYIACIYALRGITNSGIKSIIFGAVFPIAILLITFIGGGLFTSNAIGFLPVSLGNVPAGSYMRSLFLVLIGNFLGTFVGASIIFIAELLPSYETYFSSVGSYTDTYGGVVINLFAHKAAEFGMMVDGNMVNATPMVFFKIFMSNLASGIFCNILVAATLWFTFATKNAAAVILLLCIDIFAFAISGFAHVVANGFIFFMGMLMSGMTVNTGTGTLEITSLAVFYFLIANLLPAMIGNLFGGGVMLPFMAYGMYGRRVRLTSKKMKLEFYVSIREEIIKHEEYYKELTDSSKEKDPVKLAKMQIEKAKTDFKESKDLSKSWKTSAVQHLRASRAEYKLVIKQSRQDKKYIKIEKKSKSNKK
ncbi:formate/nitrite transporter family protein [Spiroplasma endosymbiont of Labia minor]|uniref:formate/nitrite transporter family protein n=1 Tax=Spiroplasma endosymbiont of Labia minor TaxID=3066305 RepID=UPI0030D16298